MQKLFDSKFFIAAGCVAMAIFFPEVAEAQFIRGQGFESRLGNLRDALIGIVLPLISSIALAYAAMLALFGSGEGRGKVIGVVVMSIVGFMARYIIEFFQSITG